MVKNKILTVSNFRDFDWNKAKLFYHIAKCGSFLEAARLTGLEQSTLTRQVQGLEKQIGCPLLIRRVSGVTLTRKGEELLSKVTPFFLEVKGFCGNNYVEIGGKEKRKIRIASSHAVAAYILNDLLLKYNREHPIFSFELIVNDYSIDVILDDVDIAIRPCNPKEKGIQQEHLFTLEKKLYASQKYLEQYGEPATIADLKYHHFLSYPISADYPYSDVSWVLKVGMPDGELREPSFTSNSVECLVDAAKNDMGIMSGYEQMKIFREAGLKNILPNINGEITNEYFIYPDYLKEDLDVMRIKDYLKTKLNSKHIS